MSHSNNRINMNFRIPEHAKNKFLKKAQKYGATGSDLLREFIEAFNDDRLKIEPDPKKPSIYTEGN